MDYKELNRKSWNDRVESHVNSDFYDLKSFLEGKSSLNAPELKLLGDVTGKSILHLQCHFGQDSISLARMGAHVTGADLSDKAIDKAREINLECGTNAQFVVSDIYDLPNHLDAQFDIVFTSYGTIGWLPDLDQWAQVINHFLKPSGQFIFAEFHPVVWMFDDNLEHIQYNYFNREEIVETTQGTYADKNAPIENQTISWNHNLAEVFQALMSQKLSLIHFEEYDFSPYNCFNGLTQLENGTFQFEKFGSKFPMMYTLVAQK